MLKVFARLSLLLCVMLVAACEETIVHDLTEQQANRARIILGRAGIAAKKQLNGQYWELQVDDALAPRALATLEAARLFPSKSARGESEGFGIVQSAEQRVYAIQEQQARKIEETLERIPGVLESRVHLNRPPDVPFQHRDVASGSASVLLVSEDGRSINLDGIKELVSGAFGIPAEKVSVVPTVSSSAEFISPDEIAAINGFIEQSLETNVGSAIASHYPLFILFAVVFVALLFFIGTLLRFKRKVLLAEQLNDMNPQLELQDTLFHREESAEYLRGVS